MIEIIAFDLDGTLAESKIPITAGMARLLQDLATHVKVAVISGQPFKNFEDKVISPWLQNSPSAESNKNLIILPEDGGKIYEYKENEWANTFVHPFPDELKKKAINAMQEIIQKGGFDIPPKSEIFGDYVEDRGSEVSFSAYGQNAPLDKKAAWDPDRKKRMKIKAELDKIIGDFCETSVAGTTTIDILPKGWNKAAGLQSLLQELKIDPKKMMFVGDSVFPGGNDYSPLQAGIKTVSVRGPEATTELIQSFIKRNTELK